MNKPMITRLSRSSDTGSCHYCQRGKLRQNGIGLEYPYDYVIRVQGTAVSSNFCPDCWESLITSNPDEQT